MVDNTLIELKNISYTNVDYLILDNVNLKIERNAFTTIVGSSGSGKSTLLKILAGILIPDSGIIKINNKDISNFSDNELLDFKRKIGFVFQDAALISNLSIKENLTLPLRFHFKNIFENEINEKIIQILKEVNLLESLNERPAQLSLGEKKLIAIARALIVKPEVLFLDESLTSLDPSRAKRMLKLIKEYYKTKKPTIIAVSNLSYFVTQLSEKIAVVENKKIIFYDSKDNILKKDRTSNPEIINDIFF